MVSAFSVFCDTRLPYLTGVASPILFPNLLFGEL